MNVTLTNIGNYYTNERQLATATLRNEDGSVLRPGGRLAEQLSFIKSQGYTLTNPAEVLDILVMRLGFAA